MEILAGLILSNFRKKLPVPWYNRAALGLESGTKVHVALATATGKSNYEDRPPDIIVTPLDINKFGLINTITVDMSENTGEIQKILHESKKNFNISLMETVTIDQRTKHRITLVIESNSESMKSKFFGIYVDELITKIKDLGGEIKFGPYKHTSENIVFQIVRHSTYQDEFIPLTDIEEKLDKYNELWHKFDRDKIVVSSTTDARFIRYVFPRKGSIEISVRHADKPAAMAHVSEQIGNLGFNILLSRVSKSQKISNPDTSVSVAICEPFPNLSEKDIDYINLRDNLSSALDEIERNSDIKYMFSVAPVSTGHHIENLRSARFKRHHTKIIKVPFRIQSRLKSYYEEKRKIVFISQKTSARDDEHTSIFLDNLYEKIESRGWVVFDGYQRPEILSKMDAQEIYARLWRSDAAVFIGVGDSGKADLLSGDQKAEWGVASVVVPNVIVCSANNSITDQMSGMLSGFAEITFDTLTTKLGREKLIDKILDKLEKCFLY